MSETRKIIRAFLGSPGDLPDERRAIRDVVTEFNDSWAERLGYHVELVGWEDTVARFGRPQHLINQDLDRCDLFVGMMWKRWGTPPDTDGRFTSGFHEEFERSVARRENGGRPEISLFFKQVPSEFLSDPGDDLRKVLEFRERIKAEKKILFQDFASLRDLESLIRKCISAFVNRVKDDDAAEGVEGPASQARDAFVGEEIASQGRTSADVQTSSPLSSEGLQFLRDLVDRMEGAEALDGLEASDVARFRLLANTVSKPGNHDKELGAHDLNLLFVAHAREMKLGRAELLCLTRLGFQYLENENVPLWCWYSTLSGGSFDPAVVSAFAATSEEEKVGAIRALTLLGRPLPIDNDPLPRGWVLDSWFSEDSPPTVRNVALAYLSKYGSAGDIPIAQKEYDRSDHSTSRAALECMLNILHRTKTEVDAAQFLIRSQFDSIDDDTLSLALSGLVRLDSQDLALGLEHRNERVRLESLKALRSTGLLIEELASRMTLDPSALVRFEAISALSASGKLLSEEEVKAILIPPGKKTNTGSGERTSAGNKLGQRCFEDYQMAMLVKLSEQELEKRVASSLAYDDEPYFALAERYFSTRAAELRRDVDDRFDAYYEERVRRMERRFGGSSSSADLITRTRNLSDFLRRKLTRKGLDLLCRYGQSEDVQRIRENLKSGYAGAMPCDAEFLGQHGRWADIPLLASLEPLRETAFFAQPEGKLDESIAKAINRISRIRSFSEVVRVEMKGSVLRRVITHCPESKFSKISDKALLSLLDHGDEEVRRSAALKAVRAIPARRVKAILAEYISRDEYRYYNVFHWLDLGSSMPRRDARKVATSATR